MKKITLLYSLFLIALGGIVLSAYKTSGAHQSSTGAPGEQTCAQTGCHADASVANDNTNSTNTLTFSSADSSYVPGQTYTLTVEAKKSGIQKMGLEVVALTKIGDKNTGTWIITDTKSTQIISGTIGADSRKYITHKSAGTTIPYVNPGMGKWTFAWTAPATNEGNIVFYYCTNMTNNNSLNTGDQLFLSNFTIHPTTGSGIAQWINESDLLVSSNPSSKELTLLYSLKKECSVSLSLYDVQGKIVLTQNAEYKSAGKNTDRLNSSGIHAGVYTMQLIINHQSISKKVVVQ
jgi:hypothetical protein